jgi:hypothetical protein
MPTKPKPKPRASAADKRTLLIDDEAWAMAEAAAAREDRSISYYIRQLIRRDAAGGPCPRCWTITTS